MSDVLPLLASNPPEVGGVPFGRGVLGHRSFVSVPAIALEGCAGRRRVRI